MKEKIQNGPPPTNSKNKMLYPAGYVHIYFHLVIFIRVRSNLQHLLLMRFKYIVQCYCTKKRKAKYCFPLKKKLA